MPSAHSHGPLANPSLDVSRSPLTSPSTRSQSSSSSVRSRSPSASNRGCRRGQEAARGHEEVELKDKGPQGNDRLLRVVGELQDVGRVSKVTELTYILVR